MLMYFFHKKYSLVRTALTERIIDHVQLRSQYGLKVVSDTLLILSFSMGMNRRHFTVILPMTS